MRRAGDPSSSLPMVHCGEQKKSKCGELAGGLGAGWIRDLWRIPEYVREASGEEEFLESLRERMRNRRKPRLSVTSVVATVDASLPVPARAPCGLSGPALPRRIGAGTPLPLPGRLLDIGLLGRQMEPSDSPRP